MQNHNPSTWKAEAKGLGVQGQLRLQVLGQPGLHKTLEEGKELVKGVCVKKERGRQVKGKKERRKGENGKGRKNESTLNVFY